MYNARCGLDYIVLLLVYPKCLTMLVFTTSMLASISHLWDTIRGISLPVPNSLSLTHEVRCAALATWAVLLLAVSYTRV
jgi:hypothetical protein